jgi:cold shock CspA family protein
MQPDNETLKNVLVDNAVSIDGITDTPAIIEKFIGQVKWFNNKAGYGFITTTGIHGENDVFAHYTTIQASNTQYKYLVLGEYVEFQMIKSVNQSHEFQATTITGINGGRLMCETRQMNRVANTELEDTHLRGPPLPTKRKNYDEYRHTPRGTPDLRKRENDDEEYRHNTPRGPPPPLMKRRRDVEEYRHTPRGPSSEQQPHTTNENFQEVNRGKTKKNLNFSAKK